MSDSAKSRRDVVFGTAAAVFLASKLQSNAQTTTPLDAQAQTPSPSAANPATTLDDRFTKLDAAILQLQTLVGAKPTPIGNGGSQQSSTLYQRDQVTWAAVQQAAKALYSVSPDLAQTPFSFKSSHIGADLAYSTQPGDSFLRLQFAELLLDQAADLLERALSQRSDYRAAAATSFNIAAEIQSFFELDQIHLKEAAAGFYTHEAFESQDESNGLISTQNLSADLVDYLNFVLTTYLNSQAAQQNINAAQLLAWVGHLATYDIECKGANFMTYTYPNTVPEQPEVLAQGAAGTAALHSMFLENANWFVSAKQAHQTNLQALYQAASASTRAAWDTANVNFRLQRTQVSRRIADAKSQEYTRADGALNYALQMAELNLRFQRDFRDALVRASVAADGMRRLYGYTVPLPDSVKNILSNKGVDPTAFDACLVWVRDAIAFRTAFSLVEQKYVSTFSLRQILGEGNFNAGKNAGSWTFGLPDSLFPKQYYVRLRGLNAFVSPKQNGDVDAGVWNISILPPSASYCSHVPVNGAAPHQESLVQDYVSPALCGRIGIRQSHRAPDLIGGSTFYNLSPFGQWTVTLSQMSTEGSKTSALNDVLLDLYLAARTVA